MYVRERDKRGEIERGREKQRRGRERGNIEDCTEREWEGDDNRDRQTDRHREKEKRNLILVRKKERGGERDR